jgi:hypothetical protein
MPNLQMLITETELHAHETHLSWRNWLLVFAAGLLCGATADLAALWLFAHWMHH